MEGKKEKDKVEMKEESGKRRGDEQGKRGKKK